MQRQFPEWRMQDFNKILLVFSGVLILGFLVGVLNVGVTQWALVGRLVGWFVLLGYLSAGYLLVAFSGNKGLRRLMETLSIVMVSILLWSATYRFLSASGFIDGALPYNFEAYSGNRNALAFQIISVMSLLLAYLPLFTAIPVGALRKRKQIFGTVTLGILLVGLAWAGSRAGWLAGGAVVVAAIASGALRWRTLFQSCFVACLLWFGFYQASSLVDLQTGDGSYSVRIHSFVSGESSNSERWKSGVEAIRLWLNSPIWGAGLGTFLAESIKLMGHPQVVHSTPLWILAEFGLIGIAFIMWVVRRFICYLRPTSLRLHSPHRLTLIFLLLGFAVFSLFHEILYQRIMWLILGAAIALPSSVAKREK